MKYARGCEYCWWFSRAHRWGWLADLAWFVHAHTVDHRRASTTGTERP